MPEESDIEFRPALYVGAGIALTVILISAALWLTLPRLSPNDHGFPPTAGPELQTIPAADLVKLRVEEDAKLNTYGWIDRPSGAIHIPIARAMELTAKEGAELK